jgi:hypothetical protein
MNKNPLEELIFVFSQGICVGNLVKILQKGPRKKRERFGSQKKWFVPVVRGGLTNPKRMLHHC